MKIEKYLESILWWGETVLDLAWYLSLRERLFFLLLFYSKGICSHEHVILFECSLFPQKLAIKAASFKSTKTERYSMGNSTGPVRLSTRRTSVYLSHLSDLRPITLHWADYPSAKLTSRMTLLCSQTQASANTIFLKYKFPETLLNPRLHPQATQLCQPQEYYVCKDHQRRLPEIYIQGFVAWIYGWELSKSPNSLQSGWAELVQWPMPVLWVSYAYLISSSSTTQMPWDSVSRTGHLCTYATLYVYPFYDKIAQVFSH